MPTCFPPFLFRCRQALAPRPAASWAATLRSSLPPGVYVAVPCGGAWSQPRRLFFPPSLILPPSLQHVESPGRALALLLFHSLLTIALAVLPIVDLYACIGGFVHGFTLCV